MLSKSVGLLAVLLICSSSCWAQGSRHGDSRWYPEINHPWNRQRHPNYYHPHQPDSHPKTDATTTHQPDSHPKTDATTTLQPDSHPKTDATTTHQPDGHPEIDWNAIGDLPKDVQCICRNPKTHEMMVITEDSTKKPPLSRQNSIQFPTEDNPLYFPDNQLSNYQRQHLNQISKEDKLIFDQQSELRVHENKNNNNAITQKPEPGSTTASLAPVTQPATSAKTDDNDDDETIDIVSG